MKRLVLFALLALVATPAVSFAGDDEEAAILDYSFFYGRARLDSLQLWYEAAAEEAELAVDEDLNDREINKKLRIARAKLAQLGRSMGREVKVRYYIAEKHARIETEIGRDRYKVVVIRLDKDPAWYAVWDSKGRRATKIALATLKGNRVNESMKFNFDGLSGKKLELGGTKCVYYTCGGGMGGKMWVTERLRKPLSVVQLFCESALSAFGGYRGEVLWAVIDTVQHLPVVGEVSAPGGGWTFEGGQGRGAKMGFALRKAAHRTSGDTDNPAPALEIPSNMKVKYVGLPEPDQK